MSTYDAAVVGVGPGPDAESTTVAYRSTDPTPSSMGYTHGRAYAGREDCRLVACADLVEAHAERFADAFDARAFADHREMLARVEPDVVSVTTPPAARPDIVVDCAEAGVAAVHGEKPMGWPWGACRRMVDACEREGVQLTIGHQQRFTNTARRAEKLLSAGAIGALRRVEIARVNLFDGAIHQLDLANWFAGADPEWVLGQVDYHTEHLHKGVHHENGALALWGYPDGVHGFASVGTDRDVVGAQMVLCGTEGRIEREHGDWVRVRQDGGEWTVTDHEDGEYSRRAVEHAVDCLASGADPLVDGRSALAATELVFAVRESARRRGRVDLPLETEDDPLEAMVESGALSPAPGG